MSQADLSSALERMNTDAKFVGELLRNFDEAMTRNGYVLDDAEMASARSAFNGTGPAAGPHTSTPNLLPPISQPTPVDPEVRTRQQEMANFSLGLLKSTLNNARLTYQLITAMNAVMFTMGVGLFLFAAIYGARSHNLTFTAAFAGLGVASFVALFLLGPIDKTQDALSNLIQAEVAFMNYYDQMCLLEVCAGVSLPGTNIPYVPNIERASALLQKRTEETMGLLQQYLENRSAEKHPGTLTDRARRPRKNAPMAATGRPNGKASASD